MTRTVDVAPGQKIASVWGNEIRDRTRQVFASAAERDAQWVNPPNGAECVTLDTGTTYLRTAGIWRVMQHLAASNMAAIGDTSTSAQGVRDALVVTLGAALTTATVVVDVTVAFGFSSGFVNTSGDLWPFSVGAAVSAAPLHQAVAGAWASFQMRWAWSVAPGADMSWKARINIQQIQTGSAWFNVSGRYQIFT